MAKDGPERTERTERPQAMAGSSTCRLCGPVIDINGRPIDPPGWIGADGLCYSCHLAALIPNWAEKLDWTAGPAANAAKCPKMGVPVLDCPSGARISEWILLAKARPR